MMADAAALFVKTTRFVEELPKDVIELANKRKFPIIEVPQDLRWTRLMQDATELIINRQASLLEKSRSIHRGLLGVVIRGGSWQELVDEVSKLLERRVVVLDSSLEVLGASKDLPIRVADLKASSGAPGHARVVLAHGRGREALPLQGRGVALDVRSAHRGQPHPAGLRVHLHRGRRSAQQRRAGAGERGHHRGSADGTGPGALRDRGASQGRLRRRRGQRRGARRRFPGAPRSLSWAAT